MKNAEQNPIPSGDLIPNNMQSMYVPKVPQLLGSEMLKSSSKLAMDNSFHSLDNEEVRLI